MPVACTASSSKFHHCSARGSRAPSRDIIQGRGRAFSFSRRTHWKFSPTGWMWISEHVIHFDTIRAWEWKHRFSRLHSSRETNSEGKRQSCPIGAPVVQPPFNDYGIVHGKKLASERGRRLTMCGKNSYHQYFFSKMKHSMRKIGRGRNIWFAMR